MTKVHVDYNETVVNKYRVEVNEEELAKTGMTLDEYIKSKPYYSLFEFVDNDDKVITNIFDREIVEFIDTDYSSFEC